MTSRAARTEVSSSPNGSTPGRSPSCQRSGASRSVGWSRPRTRRQSGLNSTSGSPRCLLRSSRDTSAVTSRGTSRRAIAGRPRSAERPTPPHDPRHVDPPIPCHVGRDRTLPGRAPGRSSARSLGRSARSLERGDCLMFPGNYRRRRSSSGCAERVRRPVPAVGARRSQGVVVVAEMPPDGMVDAGLPVKDRTGVRDRTPGETMP